MALINCPECRGKVSDKAEICIHCGYPIKEFVMTKNMTPTEYGKYLVEKHTKREGKWSWGGINLF